MAYPSILDMSEHDNSDQFSILWSDIFSAQVSWSYFYDNIMPCINHSGRDLSIFFAIAGHV